MQQRVFIGLGANLGDGRKCLRQALDALEESGLVRVVRLSSLYLTAPVSEVEQDDFLNAVVEVETSLTARGLLGLLLETEQRFGRVRTVHWGPRTLDLDLLFFGEEVESMPGLEVPHPEVANRGFVLVPLAEIAPRFVHPQTGRTMTSLRAAWEASVDDPARHVRSLDGTADRLR